MAVTKRVGIGLVVLGLVLALAVIPLWSSASSDAEDDQLAEEYRAAITGDRAADINADRALPIGVGAAGAVLFLAGVILVAGARPSPGS